jgi:hypothetical protein
MSASTDSLPNPIPQEKHAFKHILENAVSYAEYRRLWATFKYYWMDDET